LGPDEGIVDAMKLVSVVSEDIGLDDPSIYYWRLVAPTSELEATTGLHKCQRTVLKQIRQSAQKAHRKALPKLMERFEKLGWKSDDVFLVLQWLREFPPIIIQIDLNTILPHLRNDTHYRNQFETNTSGGLLDIKGRTKWEADLFNCQYDGEDVQASDRPKYGVINVMNDYRGVARTEIYGDSYLILKDVRLRCTFSPRDSGNLQSDSLAVLDHFAHQLLEYSDEELREVVKVATGVEACGDSTVITHLQYKEAQIHGEVCFSKHVDRLVAADMHNGSYIVMYLKEVCQKHGWKFSWASEEKQRLERERKLKSLNRSIWHKALGVTPSQDRPGSKEKRVTMAKETSEWRMSDRERSRRKFGRSISKGSVNTVGTNGTVYTNGTVNSETPLKAGSSSPRSPRSPRSISPACREGSKQSTRSGLGALSIRSRRRIPTV